jgi:hypothetical protein
MNVDDLPPPGKTLYIVTCPLDRGHEGPCQSMRLWFFEPDRDESKICGKEAERRMLDVPSFGSR